MNADKLIKVALDRYDHTISQINAYQKIEQEIWDGLNEQALYSYTTQGSWYFFESPDRFRLLHFVGNRVDEMFNPIITPQGRQLPLYTTGGMGDYNPGLEINAGHLTDQSYDVRLPYASWAIYSKQYRDRALEELANLCSGLVEIRANGIKVLTRGWGPAKLFTGTAEAEFQKIKQDLEAYWEKQDNR